MRSTTESSSKGRYEKAGQRVEPVQRDSATSKEGGRTVSTSRNAGVISIRITTRQPTVNKETDK